MGQYIITNQPEEINFEIGTDIVTRTIQNAKNLLMTQMGEVPFDRFRGFDPAIYHLPIDDLRMALMPELDRVMMWEPDVEVKKATAIKDANGEIVITVILETHVDE